jgi:hypothetical protein
VWLSWFGIGHIKAKGSDNKYVSSYPDVRGALSKAWEAYFKTKLPEDGPVDMEAISVLVQGEASRRLRPMLYAADVVRDIEDAPHFSAGIF